MQKGNNTSVDKISRKNYLHSTPSLKKEGVLNYKCFTTSINKAVVIVFCSFCLGPKYSSYSILLNNPYNVSALGNLQIIFSNGKYSFDQLHFDCLNCIKNNLGVSQMRNDLSKIKLLHHVYKDYLHQLEHSFPRGP